MKMRKDVAVSALPASLENMLDAVFSITGLDGLDSSWFLSTMSKNAGFSMLYSERIVQWAEERPVDFLFFSFPLPSYILFFETRGACMARARYVYVASKP